MAVCATCGRESPDDFVFCPGCGASLAAAPAREVRKVVTVLFCDLTGSTEIGERTDPEALRGLMNRYYDAARVALERHGGTVEKFVGDAVMAVFGIPVASEDDALRATRAAVELRDVVHGLGLEARIGVNTGSIVAGDGDSLVTGDAVNVAARLEQAAGGGEILLGDDTQRLVRDAARTDPVDLELKGKTGVVAAHRLVGLDAQAVGVARRLERPMVGRERERARLRSDFDDVVATSACRLFTLIGPAGIGKSRLVADFVEHVEGQATVARGRALSYGEGITYWPLVEMLTQLGIEPTEAIRSSPGETQLVTRALLEARAAEWPLVLVVDDLQWAESAMLDLVEHVADWSREVPILVVCVARPELLDVRPQWAGGKLNATSILLEPLADEDADQLLEGVDLDDETRRRVLATAEGNPLFLEEMAALAREARGTVDVPPTIRALLQARLDTLDEGERAVIERGAVEGHVFHRGAVAALAPKAPALDVSGPLAALVRKELVRLDRSSVAGDHAFRFRHLLIRDTAYEGLPKATRADLHERLADWLDEHAELVEQDEIVGYHLEQAARYRTELDPDDPTAGPLARRAAERLGGAGRAALERADRYAARSLLRRALALVGEGSDRRRLIPDLAEVLIDAGERVEDLPLLLDELATGDARDRALATILRIRNDPAGAVDEQLALLDGARVVLEAAGDTLGLVRCERTRGWVYFLAVRFREAYLAFRRALELQRQAGNRVLRREAVVELSICAVLGGAADTGEVLRLLDELETEVEAPGPLLGATLRAARARSRYLAGDLDAHAVRVAAREEARLLEESGGGANAVVLARQFDRWVVPWVEGDTVECEAGARLWVDHTRTVGIAFHANALGNWAAALCDLGEPARAADAVQEGRKIADPNDIADQVVLDQAEAHALALTGAAERARALLERARERSVATDSAPPVSDPLYREARVLRTLGDVDDARRILQGLVDSETAHGRHRLADRYRRDLDALG